MVLITIASEYLNNPGELNLHNVSSDVWNDFNSSLKKIMKEIMWLFHGHTGSLYQRQEDNLYLFQ